MATIVRRGGKDNLERPYSSRMLIVEELPILEGMARYAGLLLAPAGGVSLSQGFICPLDKKGLNMLFCPC